MLPGLLLALREGLEAALIIGLLLASLKKLGYADRARVVWLGAGSAALLSLAVAVGLTTAGAELEGFSEALYEGGGRAHVDDLLDAAAGTLGKQGARGSGQSGDCERARPRAVPGGVCGSAAGRH